MDREERREIRKRGAASRQLTTGNNIVIKTPKSRGSVSQSTQKSKQRKVTSTPKWVPVSQDSGALITEELSLANSPLTPREREPVTKSRSTRKQGTPVTPKENIIEEYEPRARKGTKKSKAKSKSSDKLKKSEGSSRQTKTKAKSKAKAIKKEPITKTKEVKPKIPQPIQNYNEDYEDDEDDLYDNYEDRFQANLPKDESQDEGIDDTYSLGSKEVKISRLPTSTARLTSLDLVLQSLNESLEHETQKHLVNFQSLNKVYFNKILDLNLTNNRNINTLKDIKLEKHQLRKDLFETRQEINENLRKLEQIRSKYNEAKKLKNKRKKINDSLKKLPDKDSLKPEDSILTSLNNLNNVVDPNYGFLEKLKQLNSKFYEVEQS